MITLIHVDDSPADLELTKLNISHLKKDIHVEWAYSAEEALRILADHTYDCILSDYQMLGMDGLEFLKKLRNRGNSTPFIFLTGQGNEELAAEALRSGADDYFTKSVGIVHYERLVNSIFKNVNAQKHLHEKKRAEEKATHLGLLFDSSMHEIFIFDASSYSILHVNHEGLENLGFSMEELQNMTPFDITPELTIESFEAVVEPLKKGEKNSVIFETVSRRKDLSEYPVEVRLQLSTFEEDQVYVAVITDISERKETERSLLEQNLFLNNVLESLTHPFYVIDMESHEIVLANSATRKDFGEEKATCYALTHRSDRPCAEYGENCPLEVVRKTKKPFRVEHIHYDQHGEARIFEVHGYPHFDENGNVVRMIEYSLDVTERKNTEKALKESEKRFRMVVERSPIAMAIINLRGQIEYVNNKFVETFGYTIEDIATIDHLWTLAFPDPDYREKIRKAMSEEIKGAGLGRREIGPREYEVTCKDGSIRQIELKFSMVGSLGVALGYDITDQRSAEEERLRLTEALKKKNEELEAFSYSVSHDLKAPLRRVEGYTRLLVDELKEGLSERHRGYLLKAHDAGVHMGHIINDLLKLSHVSEAEYRQELFDLGTLVQEVAEKLATEDPNRKVEFEIRKDVMVEADSRYMEIVVENLIGNAWKFTSKTDDAKIIFDVELANSAPIYFVRDNGAGFDRDQADQLFVPLKRLHSNQEFEGNGIGLATVKRIIRRFGGRVWAEGEKGKGATFYFTLSHEVSAS